MRIRVTHRGGTWSWRAEGRCPSSRQYMLGDATTRQREGLWCRRSAAQMRQQLRSRSPAPVKRMWAACSQDAGGVHACWLRAYRVGDHARSAGCTWCTPSRTISLNVNYSEQSAVLVRMYWAGRVGGSRTRDNFVHSMSAKGTLAYSKMFHCGNPNIPRCFTMSVVRFRPCLLSKTNCISFSMLACPSN